MKTTRLEFVQGALAVCVAGVLAAACGSDEDANPGGGGTGGGGELCTTSIGTNHGHTMTVTQAHVDAGTAKTYDIQGGSPHSHTVELSADDFADLAAGTTLIVTSSTDAGHSHEITIVC